MKFHNNSIMYIFQIIAISLLIANCYGDTEDSRVANAFIENGLVPEVFDEAPENYLYVYYPNVAVDLGNLIDPSQAGIEPNVTYSQEVNEIDQYTLVFFGPDFPLNSTPKYTQNLHWLVVNIPGEDIEAGDYVTSYFPPTPVSGSPIYVFLLYGQNNTIDPDTLSDLSVLEPGFDVMEFKNNNNLIGPIAGNFMRVESSS